MDFQLALKGIKAERRKGVMGFERTYHRHPYTLCQKPSCLMIE